MSILYSADIDSLLCSIKLLDRHLNINISVIIKYSASDNTFLVFWLVQWISFITLGEGVRREKMAEHSRFVETARKQENMSMPSREPEKATKFDWLTKLRQSRVRYETFNWKALYKM